VTELDHTAMTESYSHLKWYVLLTLKDNFIVIPADFEAFFPLNPEI
jgi:hypothetical protein